MYKILVIEQFRQAHRDAGALAKKLLRQSKSIIGSEVYHHRLADFAPFIEQVDVNCDRHFARVNRHYIALQQGLKTLAKITNGDLMPQIVNERVAASLNENPAPKNGQVVNEQMQQPQA